MSYFPEILMMPSLDILFSGPMNFSNEITKKLKLGKSIKKYFVPHQKLSKKFHSPWENPPASPPTYLMHGP